MLWQRYVAKLGAPSSAAAGLLLLEIIHEDYRYFHPKRWSVHQHADSNVELVNKLLDADDARFYTLTRMTKGCFHYVLGRIETHIVFQGAEMGPRRRIGVQMQLFVFCYSLGRCLDTLASSVIANLSHGTAHAIMGRVSKAIIMTLEAEEVQWPNVAERQVIKAAFAEKGLPNAVGCIDGTQIRLHQKPQYQLAPIRDRKGHWSIKAIVVCDHERKVTAAYVGFNGNAHDSSCFKTTPIGKYPQLHFSSDEYLLGDAGFMQTPTMLTPVTFRNVPVFSRDDSVFNQNLSSARSVVENVFGIIKSRWGAIDPLKVRGYDQQIGYVKCAIILHNICLRFNNDPLARARTPPPPPLELDIAEPGPTSQISMDFNERRARIVETMLDL